MTRSFGRGFDQRGFTVAELIVAIAILALVLAGTLAILMTGTQGFLTGMNQGEAQAAARAALQILAEEVRNAGVNPTGTGTWRHIDGPVNGAGNPTGNPSATGFTIHNDLDGDGTICNGGTGANCVVGTESERVSYKRSTTAAECPTAAATSCLVRWAVGIDASWTPVIGGVQNLQFTYLDAGGVVCAAPCGAPATIRTIQIQITTRPERQPGIWQAGRTEIAMRDQIRIRNR